VGWVGLVLAIAAGSVAFVYRWRLRSMSSERQALAEQLAEETERSALLARARDRLAGAFDALEDGVIVVDDQGEIVVMNTVAERYQGARRADVLAGEAASELLTDALRGVPGERELALFGPPRVVLQLRAEPLWTRGRVVGAVVWVRDVTEPRRVDDVRRDFVANVSHELRTPIGALALLAETMADETDLDQMRAFAERMVREADRLARIVDDLLDLSLLEAEHSDVHEIVDVRSVVHDAVEQVASAADAAAIALHVAAVPQGLKVEGDRRQLVSAVFNLLDNAIKYSEPGAAVDVTVEEGNQSVAVMVRDHGIGIPTRDLERIFERFYRVDRARSRDTGGTGLGLSIVRHVAHAHGGEVSVISHEGEGSVFTLSVLAGVPLPTGEATS
jgi:two-component system sensor histidine kinase SenX3